MHRTPALSWLTALTLVRTLSLSPSTINAWSFGRTTSSSSRRSGTRSFFPRRYRELDHQDEAATVGGEAGALRSLWKLSMPKSSRKSRDALVETTGRVMMDDTASNKTEAQSSSWINSSSMQGDEHAPSSSDPQKWKTTKKRPIRNVHELRAAVLDDGLELRQTQLNHEPATVDNVRELLNHNVLQLLAHRYKTDSMPGHRQDNATLALCIEGGGMRGAVSAGMAAAIASLGLCNAFDSIVGSSAGSVVGAYMVSRQMCVDVYTQVLPAAQSKFVCKKRMVRGLLSNAVDLMLRSVFTTGNTTNGGRGRTRTPGMNISFVLDGIMDTQHGLRPLDMEAFRENDRVQPLRIATSCVQNGKLVMKCLGTTDFFDHFDPLVNRTVPATARQDKTRKGLFACLEAGMTVPGATGAPVVLTNGNNVTLPYFDAFCFEPLPYRSAVEDGASHVLVLRSRPECFQAKTSPGVYERGVAPLYFRSHGEENVARFFEKGGQQFIYLEDLLTLEDGRVHGLKDDSGDGIHIPPTTILYGVEQDDHSKQLASNRDAWKKAHVMPITVPKGTPELPTIEQGQDKVLEAVRGGFAAAFDILAPAIDLEMEPGMTGKRVASLVFPKQTTECLDGILAEQVPVQGRSIDIVESQVPERSHSKRRVIRSLALRLAKPFRQRQSAVPDVRLATDMESLERCHREDAEALLSLLPGIQNGNLPPISDGLHFCRAIDTLL